MPIHFDFRCNTIFVSILRNYNKKQILRMLWMLISEKVDGSHWNGHKKVRKGWELQFIKCCHTIIIISCCRQSSQGGHLGCSTGYNSALYRDSIHPKLNSSGREQIHSKLEKLKPSLRAMNYQNFMVFMKIFFGFNNLRQKKII